jgi:hypothetical protein
MTINAVDFRAPTRAEFVAAQKLTDIPGTARRAGRPGTF